MEELILTFLTDLISLLAIYFVLNLSLNLELGYVGVPNFGLVLAVTGGAYVVGWLPIRLLMHIYAIDSSLSSDILKNNVIIVTQINHYLQRDPLIGVLTFILTLLVAMCMGGALGILAAYPAIRLRSDYLAITLLALGEILSIIGRNYEPLVGGVIGIMVPDSWSWLGSIRFLLLPIILLGIAALTALFLEILSRSPVYRTFRAVRDNEIAAASLGKDIVKVRISALVLGSMMSGLAGALYAFYSCYVGPDVYGRMEWTFLPWLMVVFGGLGNNKGVLLGTSVFITFRKLIIFYKEAFAFLPFDVVWMEYLLLSLLLLIIVILRPQGLIKEKPGYTLPRDKLVRISQKFHRKRD
jgi:branched-chain amino acid transport system permease protein